MLTGPVGIAYASQRGAVIGKRSHYRHTCHMTPSHYRRVKPLSAHVRDNASPHCRTPHTLRSHYRHAQSVSALATHRARPLSARPAIIGPRDAQREPSSTLEAIKREPRSYQRESRSSSTQEAITKKRSEPRSYQREPRSHHVMRNVMRNATQEATICSRSINATPLSERKPLSAPVP